MTMSGPPNFLKDPKWLLYQAQVFAAALPVTWLGLGCMLDDHVLSRSGDAWLLEPKDLDRLDRHIDRLLTEVRRNGLAVVPAATITQPAPQLRLQSERPIRAGGGSGSDSRNASAAKRRKRMRIVTRHAEA